MDEMDDLGEMMAEVTDSLYHTEESLEDMAESIAEIRKKSSLIPKVFAASCLLSFYAFNVGIQYLLNDENVDQLQFAVSLAKNNKYFTPEEESEYIGMYESDISKLEKRMSFPYALIPFNQYLLE